MANTAQLEKLKSGVEAWNKWRKENPDIKIDLSEAKLWETNLLGANLTGANLTGANLSEAQLIAVNFSEAQLIEANLTGANLAYANFNKAQLIGANLSNAHLNDANLCEVMLNNTDFSRADLQNVDLTGVDLTGAGLTGAMLARTKLSKAYPLNIILTQGVEVWNKWRDENPGMEIDLAGVNLSGTQLNGANLTGVNLNGANLSGAHLNRANLSGVHLNGAELSQAHLRDAKLINTELRKASLWAADLMEADFSKADLSGADLRDAKLINTDLIETNLSESDLTGADLSLADMVRTKVTNAIANKCNVYGASVWDLQGKFKEQMDLILSSSEGPDRTNITTNNIKDAQFINLILDNPEIRSVLNTLTSKAVLILGRFANDERKAVLDRLRKELRQYNLLPIVFDFERPEDKDFTETIKTLAGMCYFVIADITSPKSSPLELQATVPDYQIPFVPIIQELEGPFAMMQNLQTKYPWVLDTISYKDADQLIRILKKGIIERAEKKRDELRSIKKRKPKVIMASKFEEKVP